MSAFARTALLAAVILASAHAQSTCVSFPAGFIPFSPISYITAADSAGDHLVVGVPAAGAINFILANVPVPASANQTFCDAQVQLAPGQFYSNVYVPTSAEVAGIFTAFAGLLIVPGTSQPYPNGVIPAGQLNNVFAWRIGPAQPPPAVKSWSPSGSMEQPRSGHATVLLPGGKVLIVGGNTLEIFDPATGAFTPAGQNLVNHGTTVGATLLNDGRVLIEGGSGAPSSAELYDPVSGQSVATGRMAQLHGFYQTATLLPDGRVLVVGGNALVGSTAGDLNSGAEIYDPGAGTFSSAGIMATNRNSHTATLLANGRVLIAGGRAQGVGNPGNPPLQTAEIYDPSSGSFSPTSSTQQPRASHFAVLLANDKVLFGGGASSGATAELFDPAAGVFTATGSMSNSQRASGCAILLPSGQVLVAGGNNALTVIATNAAELYDPGAGTFETTSGMGSPRANFTATLLLDGRVLAAGGTPNSTTVLSSAEVYTPVTEGLITSQTGLTFRAPAGSVTPPPQSAAVLSNTTNIPWTVSTHTYQGGSWLTVAPAGGNSVPGAAPVTLTITANPSGLTAPSYYGAVVITPTDGIHPAISIAIVLSIVPAGAPAPPGVTPSGLLFLGAPGAALQPQAFTISNLTSSAVAFSSVVSATPLWFFFNPTSGIVNGAQSTSIQIMPSIEGLAAGVYTGSVKINFSDGSSQTIQLLLVLSATAGTANADAFTPHAAAACTATRLLPVFTTLGTGFGAAAAWPAPIVVQVVDDCGTAVNTGSVIVSFTNGDPPINLLSTGNGAWAGTWVPQNNAAGITVRADAQQLGLTGSLQVTGQVLSNPTVPVVSADGVVSSGDFSSAPAVGLLVSIFGSGLADAPTGAGLPLPPQLGSTSVFLSGSATPLPLLYAADSIVNVQIPYDSAINTTQQLIVQRGNAISVPMPIAVFTASPTVLSTSGAGSGQGHVYVIGAGGVETLANQNAPATAGNPVVIYCIGLGAVTPAIDAGAITPPALLSANAPVTVTFGNQTVPAGFAGLTPGLAGLYQVNVNIPPGVTPGNQVPVTISVGGKSSAGSIFMAVK